jgi:hypothetical protein
MNIYIELWKSKDAWLSLPLDERQSYMAQMQPSIRVFLEKGAKIHSWGTNNKANDLKADYTWFAIWEFPNDELITEFEALLQGAKWYDYFEQINISGDNVGPESTIGSMLNI